MDPQLEGLAKASSRIRLRKIDLSDRSAAGPVASQHGVRGIPMLVLFDGTREVSRDARTVLEKLATER
ncbi:MAG TPA: thioredoxin family protein [Planctomycetota bacterium]|nr:thioredoxin family protein [Planctomycetota bacterium]